MKTLLPVEATVHPAPWWLAVQLALALASSSKQHRFSSRSRVALGGGGGVPATYTASCCPLVCRAFLVYLFGFDFRRHHKYPSQQWTIWPT